MAFIPVYILILFFLIVIDFFAAQFIEKSKGKKRKLFLLISILSTVGILFVFKYFNFFADNLTALAHFLDWNYPITYLNILLPLGLSFHTFQSLSYVVEVYRKKYKAEKNFGIYALYVMFFPQLVAGPIERPQQMLPQFYKKMHFDSARVTDGLKIMVLGFFKKIVIADRLAVTVNTIYASPQEYVGIPLILATIAFAFQIYCDFSGYTDIAIGSAKVLGFNLVQNFNYPYISQSVREFWRRWHISLSTWFRDYVYIPLGGNKVSTIKHYRNLMISFLLSGVWHGASWNFVIWGVLNGVYIIVQEMVSPIFTKISSLNIPLYKYLYKTGSILVTFMLICIGWIFFRAKDLNEALYILTHMHIGVVQWLKDVLRLRFFLIQDYTFKQGENGLGVTGDVLLITIFMVGVLLVYELLERKEVIKKLPSAAKWVLYIFFVLAIINLSVVHEVPFIYFQF